MTIKIERVIEEISPMQNLEKSVYEAGETVKSWQSNIAAIEMQIANSDARLTKAEDRRKQFALDASLGNPDAIAEIAQARLESAAAEGDLNDLGHALSQAKQKLIVAESEAKGARQALAKFEGEALMRNRIDVARKLDKVIAEFTHLHEEFEKLGNEIINKDVLPRSMFGSSMSHDGAIGTRRVRAALPKLFDRVYPNALHDEAKKEPLATSEQRHWFGTVEATTKAA